VARFSEKTGQATMTFSTELAEFLLELKRVYAKIYLQSCSNKITYRSLLDGTSTTSLRIIETRRYVQCNNQPAAVFACDEKTVRNALKD
jgi:hypothetical protein